MPHLKHLLLISLLSFAVSVQAQSGTLLKNTVDGFLNTLSPAQAKACKYDFDHPERKKWTNLPIGLVPRAGIAYGNLSDQSRLAFHRVLVAALSSQGYLKATSIMALDDILNTLYQEAFDQGKINEKTLTMTQNLKWAYGNFYISVWEKPDVWGLNFGGHHLALNLTVQGNTIITSPFFYGTDPSEVKNSKYAGWRILSKEEDYGFMLVNMLNAQQKTKAIRPEKVPEDIITSPNSAQRIDTYYGISGKELNKDQQEVLKILIQEYTHNFEHQVAHRLYDKILKNGLDKVYFAWIGSLERNQPHYYLINAPDFLIEYDNVGFQNDGNHIHAILREKGNDFGEDLLKKHYAEHKH
jgi:hypothetical protein